MDSPDINYIEGDEDGVDVHTNDATYLSSMSIENALLYVGERFLQVR